MKTVASTVNREIVHGMLKLEEKVRRLFSLDEECFELDKKRLEVDEERRRLLKEIYDDQATRTPENGTGRIILLSGNLIV